MVDWCCTNHSKLIEYYQQFMKEHPNFHHGYLWLMDNFIPDGRLEEAAQALESMRKVEDTYHYLLYKGLIAEQGGNRAEADACWNLMVEKYSDIWFAWSARGDAHAKRAEYDLAIADFKHAIRLQTVPRYTDNHESIAQICILKKDWAGAAEAYEQVVEIMRNDWNIHEGKTLDEHLQMIAQLKQKYAE